MRLKDNLTPFAPFQQPEKSYSMTLGAILYGEPKGKQIGAVQASFHMEHLHPHPLCTLHPGGAIFLFMPVYAGGAVRFDMEAQARISMKEFDRVTALDPRMSAADVIGSQIAASFLTYTGLLGRVIPFLRDVPAAFFPGDLKKGRRAASSMARRVNEALTGLGKFKSYAVTHKR